MLKDVKRFERLERFEVRKKSSSALSSTQSTTFGHGLQKDRLVAANLICPRCRVAAKYEPCLFSDAAEFEQAFEGLQLKRSDLISDLKNDFFLA